MLEQGRLLPKHFGVATSPHLYLFGRPRILNDIMSEWCDLTPVMRCEFYREGWQRGWGHSSHGGRAPLPPLRTATVLEAGARCAEDNTGERGTAWAYSVVIETFRLRVYVYGNVNGNAPRSA